MTDDAGLLGCIWVADWRTGGLFVALTSPPDPLEIRTIRGYDALSYGIASLKVIGLPDIQYLT